MGGRVLRAHVDDDVLGLGVADLGHEVVPVLAGDREDAALGGLAGARVDVVVGAFGGGARLGRGAVVLEGLVDGVGPGVCCVLASEISHQVYDLRWSAGGMVAPLYSTGIPPSG